MTVERNHAAAGAATVRLYLVRHGETEWSLSGRHTGRTDVPLTRFGESQARALAPMFAALSFSHVFTSPAQRARRTCVLAGLESRAEEEPDLAEWDYGANEGKLSSDIRNETPGWSVYRDGCPGGESVAQLTARADRLVGRLRGLHGNVALFSHGQFGCSLTVRWIGLPLTAGAHLEFDPASFGILAFSPSHPETPVIALWNVGAAA